MVDTSMPYNLQFIDKHVPALEDGDYQITINQNVESTDSKKPIAAAAYSYSHGDVEQSSLSRHG